jgi:hypothetical protein
MSPYHVSLVSPVMPLKQKGSSGAHALTPYEEDLLLVAVRLDSAVQYWEKQLNKGVQIDDLWMTEGFGDELVQFARLLLAGDISDTAFKDCVMDVFDKQKVENPEWPPPNIHPIVTLIGREYKASEDEGHSMNPEQCSTASSMDMCREIRNANPQLDKQLTLMSLYKHLNAQGEDFWCSQVIQTHLMITKVMVPTMRKTGSTMIVRILVPYRFYCASLLLILSRICLDPPQCRRIARRLTP